MHLLSLTWITSMYFEIHNNIINSKGTQSALISMKFRIAEVFFFFLRNYIEYTLPR